MHIHPKHITEELKRVYNRIADTFSQTREYLWEDLKPLARFVRPGMTIVDLGCGNGRLVQLLEGMPIEYIGVDQSEGLIALARKKFPQERFLVGELTNTRLQDACADLVFCIAAFHHLPTEALRIDALKEMKRLLKPNGHIVMINWNLYSDWARSKGFEPNEDGDFLIPWKNGQQDVLGERYYHGFLLEELHELAASAGLRIVEQHYTREGEPSSIGPGDNIFSRLQVADS